MEHQREADSCVFVLGIGEQHIDSDGVGSIIVGKDNLIVDGVAILVSADGGQSARVSAAIINVSKIHILDFFVGVATGHFHHVDNADVVTESDVGVLIVEVEVECHGGVKTFGELATIVAEGRAGHGINQIAEGEVRRPVSTDKIGSDSHSGGSPVVLVRSDGVLLTRYHAERDGDERDCKNVFLHTFEFLLFDYLIDLI